MRIKSNVILSIFTTTLLSISFLPSSFAADINVDAVYSGDICRGFDDEFDGTKLKIAYVDYLGYGSIMNSDNDNYSYAGCAIPRQPPDAANLIESVITAEVDVSVQGTVDVDFLFQCSLWVCDFEYSGTCQGSVDSLLFGETSLQTLTMSVHYPYEEGSLFVSCRIPDKGDT